MRPKQPLHVARAARAAHQVRGHERARVHHRVVRAAVSLTACPSVAAALRRTLLGWGPSAVDRAYSPLRQTTAPAFDRVPAAIQGLRYRPNSLAAGHHG